MRSIILAAAALAGLAACTTAETSTPAFDATQRALVADSRVAVVAMTSAEATRSGCTDLVVC